MSDGAKTWVVTYNSQTGSVNGKPADDPEPVEEFSTRRFLTRLHLAHGYPGSPDTRWFWAVLVDAMSFVLVFWGASGIFMWWQIKATRKLGLLILLLSLVAAQNEVCACALVEPLRKSQPTVSHHLRVLSEAGLIESEKRGRWVWYRVVPERLDSLREALVNPEIASTGRRAQLSGRRR